MTCTPLGQGKPSRPEESPPGLGEGALSQRPPPELVLASEEMHLCAVRVNEHKAIAGHLSVSTPLYSYLLAKIVDVRWRWNVLENLCLHSANAHLNGLALRAECAREGRRNCMTKRAPSTR